MNIKLEFFQPEHGWLLCKLDLGNKTIEIDASDVPNNPIENLIECFWKCCRGDSCEVWWHLEPAGYYFQFKPVQSKIDFKVLYSPNSSTTSKTVIFEKVLDMKAFLLMLWRSIKKFSSYNIVEPHWPPTDMSEMERIKVKIEEVVSDV